jgi:hypothetical protein
MKQVLFTCLMLFTLLNILSAQEENARRAWILGGSVGYNRSNSESIRTVSGTEVRPKRTDNSFSFGSYFGKELNEKWMLGLALSLGNYGTDELLLRDENVNELIRRNSSNRSLGFNVFSRYIFNPQQRFNVFLSPSLGFNNIKQEEFYNNQSRLLPNSTRYFANVGGGAFYNFNANLRGLVNFGNLGYYFERSKVPATQSKSNSSGFSSNMGLSSLSLGLELRL